jgi:N-acetylglucosaminyl-diphospho-decaprenol L-rhamnosyltransferase
VAPELEVVVVAYLSRDLVLALLDRLAGGLPVVVVDNARGRDGLAEAVAGRSGVRCLTGPGEGFARGANLGALTSEAEYLVFVNPDSAPDVADLWALVADLVADPHLAGVGATTVGPDGEVELGVGGWEPSVSRSVVHALGAHRVLPTRGLYARPVPGRPVAVDWLSGACLAVPRKVFLALGGFDEHYFVYNEDMAYGRRVREAGLGLRLRTDVLVPHLGTGSGETKPRMFQVRGASMTQYLQRHQGAGATAPTRVALTRVALTGGTALRWAHARLRGRRDLAEAHAAYLTGLWRGAPDRP